MEEIKKRELKLNINEGLWELSRSIVLLMLDIDSIKAKVGLYNAYDEEIDYQSIIAKINNIKKKLDISNNGINDLKKAVKL